MYLKSWATRSAISIAIGAAVCACALHPTVEHITQFTSALQTMRDISVRGDWEKPEAALSALHSSDLQVEHTNQEYTDHYQCPRGCPTEERRVEYKFDGWVGDPPARMSLQADLFTQTTIGTTASGRLKNIPYSKLTLKLTGDSHLSRADVAAVFGAPDGNIPQNDPFDPWDTFDVSNLLGPKRLIWFHVMKTKNVPQNNNQVFYDLVVIG